MVFNPPMSYDEDTDMTLYNRKDKLKLLIKVDTEWDDWGMLYNIIMEYHKNEYISYLVLDDSFAGKVIKKFADKEGISFVDFSADYAYYGFTAEDIRDEQMIQNGFPTKAFIFSDYILNSVECLSMIHKLERYKITYETIHH